MHSTTSPDWRQGRPIEILLVEDNPGDVLLMREALEDGKIRNELHVAVDGLQAMAFLRGEGEFAGAPRPDVVLLDLNLPRKHGREVLAEIRADSNLAGLAVVIVTGSRAEEDILRAYNPGVNCFIVKPLNLAQLMNVVSSLEHLWITIMTASDSSPPA